MIKAEVVFEDDYIVCNGKHVWLEGENQCFVVGDNFNTDIYDEIFPSLEHAIKYCMELTNDQS